MKGNNLSSKKSLQFENRQEEDLSRSVHVNDLSTCHGDDLDTSQGAAVKIIISYPSAAQSLGVLPALLSTGSLGKSGQENT